jgi:hypothetical protein
MIQPELMPQTLRALQRLIIHAKARAYDSEGTNVAEFLNDFELIPEMLADDTDRTDELVEMLHDLMHAHPDCQYIVEEFDRAAAPR